jgi:hypothetical protein
MTLIQGELIQDICQKYLGFQEDFDYNPFIKIQSQKFLYFSDLQQEYDNPTIIFCYTHRLINLMNCIHNFKNKFVLVLHNSDFNLDEKYISLINHEKIIKIFSQNLLIDNDKCIPLPIGCANSMWNHGKTEHLNLINIKSNKVFFNFNIQTNVTERQYCFQIISKQLTFQPNQPFQDYIKNLSSHEFCICPDGNGMDTHRLWECLYLKVVPIVKKNKFYEILQKTYHIPLLLLDKWEDFYLNDPKLDYSLFSFENVPYLEDIEKKINQFILDSSNELIDVIFSIPVHESIECVMDLINNLFYFCRTMKIKIILHCSLNMTIKHLQNYECVKQLNFKYFIWIASNCMLVKPLTIQDIENKNLYDVSFKIVKDYNTWGYPNFFSNKKIVEIVKNHNITVVGTEHEGTVFTKSQFEKIHQFFINHNILGNIENDFYMEETLIPSLERYFSEDQNPYCMKRVIRFFDEIPAWWITNYAQIEDALNKIHFHGCKRIPREYDLPVRKNLREKNNYYRH